MRQIVDIRGRRFGRVKVLNNAGRSPDGYILWECVCDCGNKKVIVGKYLKNGSTRSCGCLGAEVRISKATTHGMHKSSTYASWTGLIQRCYNQKDKNYLNYGGRGITVCRRWLDSFENFLADMGVKPANKTIDRNNNDGNYEKSNCQWATCKEQARNRRTNLLITHRNKTKTVVEWAEKLGINYNTLYDRIYRGWSAEKALTAPVQNHKQKGMKEFEEATL